MNRLLVTVLLLTVVTINLAAQSLFSVSMGTTREYRIDKQPTISTYLWEVYTDKNLTSQAAASDVALATMGAGRENEINATWKTTGIYYLAISVTDLSGCVNKMAYTFTVINNYLPILANDTNSTVETLAVIESDGSGNILANDTDPDGDELSIVSISSDVTGTVFGTFGQLVWTTDGRYTYTPNPELDSLYSGEIVHEIFNVTVTDGKGGDVISTLTITIRGDNELPIAQNDFNNTNENFAVNETHGSGNILSNDTDIDGDLLSIVSVNTNLTGTVAGTWGTLVWNTNGTYTYSPNSELDSLAPGEQVQEIFSMIISDGKGGTSVSTLTITLEGMDVNYPPIAVADTVIIEEDAVNNLFTVLENDIDPNNDLLTITLVKLPISGGEAVVEDDKIRYTPPTNFNGDDYFVYQICDNRIPSLCDFDTVFVTVTPVNDAPVAVIDYVTILKGDTDVSIDVLKNDYDVDGDVLTASIVQVHAGGTAVVENNKIIYTTGAESLGYEYVIYRVCDNGNPQLCDEDTVVITLQTNLAPVAVNDNYTTVLGSETTFTVSENDYDDETDLDLSSVELIDSTELGVLRLDSVTGTLKYIAYACSTGIDKFTYRIADGDGNVSNIATVTITLTIDLTADSDNDKILDVAEDRNQNGNLCDDDTDTDNIPDYLDTDDDGDRVLTQDEDVNYDGDPITDDTDIDGIPNYLDTDDDNDCSLTINEDFNDDNNYLNDDIDRDGIPNYLDNDDDGDGILSCNETEDRDGNNVLDRDENWDAQAISDFIRIGLDESVVIPVLHNDSTQMDESTLFVLQNPTHGYLTINEANWTITYEPDLNYLGEDSFVYVVCDYYDFCDTATVLIDVVDFITAPQLFTPNGDGKNDTYVIRGIEAYSNSHLVVYNRWGNVVFETVGYQNDWDGTSNVRMVIGDRVLPAGTYYYILEYGNDRNKSGALFLER